MIKENSVKNGWLKSRNLSEEKNTHPEHKYSVTFVSKVGTIRKNKSVSATPTRASSGKEPCKLL